MAPALRPIVLVLLLAAWGAPARAIPEGHAPELTDLIDRVGSAAREGRAADLDRARSALVDCVLREAEGLRLATAEALAGHLEAMRPAQRQPFAPIAAPTVQGLEALAGSGLGGQLRAKRLQALARRIGRALGGPTPATVQAPAPAVARAPKPAPPPPVPPAPPSPLETILPRPAPAPEQPPVVASIPPPPPPPDPATLPVPPGVSPAPASPAGAGQRTAPASPGFSIRFDRRAVSSGPVHMPPPPVAGLIPILVADFTEQGIVTPSSVAAADLLARSLNASGRFHVGRGVRAPTGVDAYVVDGEIYGIHAWATPRMVYAPMYWRGRRGIVFGGPWGDPFGSTVDVTVSLDGRVRVVEGWSGRVVGDKRIGSTTVTFLPYGGWGGWSYQDLSLGGTAGRVLESAILDRKSGAVRFVLDLLPVAGRVARVEPGEPVYVQVDFGTGQGVHAGDRFVVVGPEGREAAILRAEGQATSGLARLKVSGPEHGRGVVKPGDTVFSRGY